MVCFSVVFVCAVLNYRMLLYCCPCWFLICFVLLIVFVVCFLLHVLKLLCFVVVSLLLGVFVDVGLLVFVCYVLRVCCC